MDKKLKKIAKEVKSVEKEDKKRDKAVMMGEKCGSSMKRKK